jgi:hypothetical protein
MRTTEKPCDSRKRTISSPVGRGSLGTNQIFEREIQLT